MTLVSTQSPGKATMQFPIEQAVYLATYVSLYFGLMATTRAGDRLLGHRVGFVADTVICFVPALLVFGGFLFAVMRLARRDVVVTHESIELRRRIGRQFTVPFAELATVRLSGAGLLGCTAIFFERADGSRCGKLDLPISRTYANVLMSTLAVVLPKSVRFVLGGPTTTLSPKQVNFRVLRAMAALAWGGCCFLIGTNYWSVTLTPLLNDILACTGVIFVGLGVVLLLDANALSGRLPGEAELEVQPPFSPLVALGLYHLGVPVEPIEYRYCVSLGSLRVQRRNKGSARVAWGVAGCLVVICLPLAGLLWSAKESPLVAPFALVELLLAVVPCAYAYRFAARQRRNAASFEAGIREQLAFAGTDAWIKSDRGLEAIERVSDVEFRSSWWKGNQDLLETEFEVTAGGRVHRFESRFLVWERPTLPIPPAIYAGNPTTVS